jgi:hypothetical protein
MYVSVPRDLRLLALLCIGEKEGQILVIKERENSLVSQHCRHAPPLLCFLRKSQKLLLINPSWLCGRLKKLTRDTPVLVM